MKHIKFTYIDAVTGISIENEPALNGTKFPDVDGIEFVWARESAYPTEVPEFFGTCPDSSSVEVAGVMGTFIETDWLQMRVDEMRARAPVATSVSPRQIRQALTRVLLRDQVEAAVAASDRDTIDWWERSTSFERYHPEVIAMGEALGMTEQQLDDLWALANTL